LARRRRADRSLLGRLRQLFLTGLAIMLPLIITIWLLEILFGMVHGVSTPIILNILRLLRMPFVDDPAFVTYLAPLIGIVVTLLVILLVGLLTTNLLGRQIVAAFDRLMLRIPLIKGIYGGVRQLFDAFRGKSAAFRRVVAVEYPRTGVYTLGFVTREEVVMRRPQGRALEGYTLVFLPTSPNPTSGWMAAVPDSEVIPLDLSVEEGVRLIVSGGLVVPQTWDRA
jgi:uncharacterized membrane protein